VQQAHARARLAQVVQQSRLQQLRRRGPAPAQVGQDAQGMAAVFRRHLLEQGEELRRQQLGGRAVVRRPATGGQEGTHLLDPVAGGGEHGSVQ
jgi:hypothetical protein